MAGGCTALADAANALFSWTLRTASDNADRTVLYGSVYHTGLHTGSAQGHGSNPGSACAEAATGHGRLSQYLMPGNCSRARSSWAAHSRGQPKARAAWLVMSAAAAPLVKWTYSPQFIRRV